MRLSLSLLGHTLEVNLTADQPDAEDDRSRDLSGGYLGSSEVSVGFTQRWLGETGMEGGE